MGKVKTRVYVFERMRATEEIQANSFEEARAILARRIKLDYGDSQVSRWMLIETREEEWTTQ
jgi:hypothetical protein